MTSCLPRAGCSEPAWPASFCPFPSEPQLGRGRIPPLGRPVPGCPLMTVGWAEGPLQKPGCPGSRQHPLSLQEVAGGTVLPGSGKRSHRPGTREPLPVPGPASSSPERALGLPPDHPGEGRLLLSGTLDGNRGNYWVRLNVQFRPQGVGSCECMVAGGGTACPVRAQTGLCGALGSTCGPGRLLRSAPGPRKARQDQNLLCPREEKGAPALAQCPVFMIRLL